MCDTIPGELLVCFHQTDHAALGLIEDIYKDKIPHIQAIEGLRDRLSRIGLPIRKDLHFEFFRLKVPAGDEIYKINYLQFFYKIAVLEALGSHRLDPTQHADVLGRSNFHLQVVPNSVLSLETSTTGGSATFSFTPFHHDYKQMLGCIASGATTYSRKIVILDTGVDLTTSYNVVEHRNFIDQVNPNDVTDDNGHGTAVTAVIKDLCPTAELIIYKVADKNGRASEWDTLAALAVSNGADLINASLAFGLPERACPNCGRESRSSRSAVFENMIYQLQELPVSPLLIAAAGNHSLNELSFPARFDSVLAIESIDLAGNLSDFTNRSTKDHVGKTHTNVFILPGGQKFQGVPPTEYVGTSAGGKQHWGTSFSAAYASGLIAALWSTLAHSQKDGIEMLNHLKANAEKNLPSYDPATYGNGMMRFI